MENIYQFYDNFVFGDIIKITTKNTRPINKTKLMPVYAEANLLKTIPRNILSDAIKLHMMKGLFSISSKQTIKV